MQVVGPFGKSFIIYYMSQYIYKFIVHVTHAYAKMCILMSNFVFPWMKATTEANTGHGAADPREYKKKAALLVCYNYSHLAFIVMLVYVSVFILYQLGLDIICCVGSQKGTKN